MPHFKEYNVCFAYRLKLATSSNIIGRYSLKNTVLTVLRHEGSY